MKIEELKKIQKRVKKDHQLALDLYATGIYDAMYLAGLIADETRMTKRDLERWVKEATCEGLCSYTVAWVAAESAHGWELALKWIDSPNENVACAGWATLSGLVALKDDSELDLPELKKLLKRVQKTIHEERNRVRYLMNGFLISVGSYVEPLTEEAMRTAEKVGQVEVDMGETSCQVPLATTYIEKVKDRGKIGKKRKTVRC